MNIYNKSSIIAFYEKHAASKVALQVWYQEVSKRMWKGPQQIKKEYKGNASILKNGRVVFNIKGNDYRIVCLINYENGWLFIKFIGTHVMYDKIDANTIDVYKATKKK